MHDRPDLAALIGSRICHDLISPIGAIGNGVELLQMDGGTEGPEMALIADSVQMATARIRLFRIAFGLTSDEQRMGSPEVTGILAGITRGTRLAIHWTSTADLPRSEAKLLFLAILCLESALAFGGRITVEHSERGWVLTAHATKLRLQPDLWALLANPDAPCALTPAQVHFALLGSEAARQSRRPLAELRETEIRLAL